MGGQRDAGRIPRLHPGVAGRIQLRETVLRPVREQLDQRPDDLLPGQWKTGRGAAHRAQPAARRGGIVPVPVDGRSGARLGGDRGRLREPVSPRAQPRRGALRRVPRGDPGAGARARMTTRDAPGVRERLERALEPWQEPGAAELCAALEELVSNAARPGERLDVERLKPAVQPLSRAGGGAPPLLGGRAQPRPPALEELVSTAARPGERLAVERLKPAVQPLSRSGGVAHQFLEGCAQLRRAALEELVSNAARPGERLDVERLKPAVYRVRIGSAPGRDLVLKRHPPAVAQTDRLVVERWLPALELADGCPQLLAAVAEHEGSWVWHVYEDLGDGNLAADRPSWRLDPAVGFLAA